MNDVLIENPKDGTLLALIPEGDFLAGGEGSDEESGPFLVRLPAYYLALTCVTNAQYARFLSETSPSQGDLEKWIQLDGDRFLRLSGKSYEACGGKEDHPVVAVSWYGAKAYCEWAGLRLPRELEWEKGARGIDGRKYPWGRNWDMKKCRSMTFEGVCTVWGYPEGASPFGLYQMSGNVWEWCADTYHSDAYIRYKRGNLSLRPDIFASRVLRGGSWCSMNKDIFCCAGRTSRDLTSLWEEDGFRCARAL